MGRKSIIELNADHREKQVPGSLTRRVSISSVAIVGAALGMQFKVGLPLSAAQPARIKSMQAWMDAWSGTGARDPVGGLYVYRFKEPMWALTKSVGWRPDHESAPLQPVDVPTGFVTDFASIPRAFYSLLRPDGEYAYAAVIHDYLYWTQGRPRHECDEVFKACMQDFKINNKIVDIIFRAVRTFGGSAWEANKRLKVLGEQRFLAKLPEDPRITWAEWKKDRTVFADPPR
ncbi:DUF1353 domain-containing protein [Methylobacterium sp. PvR107]|uniref:DUF1353 domain-containing protein n=1 Tax=Methylobacterium sp. PvR107 TaxID=2806597 RepID=UPI001AE3CE40|nr:DUF1353 domain-containing protein [Methylobacterium sp. PvR107]MBP1184182.1 hypothetical protein [Methylobacterium sp. PvR107]